MSFAVSYAVIALSTAVAIFVVAAAFRGVRFAWPARERGAAPAYEPPTEPAELAELRGEALYLAISAESKKNMAVVKDTWGKLPTEAELAAQKTVMAPPVAATTSAAAPRCTCTCGPCITGDCARCATKGCTLLLEELRVEGPAEPLKLPAPTAPMADRCTTLESLRGLPIGAYRKIDGVDVSRQNDAWMIGPDLFLAADLESAAREIARLAARPPPPIA